MISLEAMEALLEAGGTLEMAIAMMRADRQRRITRRCERAVMAALFPAREGAAASGAEMAALDETATPPDMNNAAMDGRIETGNAATDSRKRTFARAREAVERAAGLTATESRVALGILSHVNHATGRCDPSLDRIRRVANTSERTARRAVRRLVSLGLFDVAAHGGARHANAYRPRWAALLALPAVPRSVGGTARGASPVMNNLATPVQSGQIDAANPATGGPQTSESNLNLDRSGGTRRPHQMSMMLPLDFDRARQTALVRAESALRGKYRLHEERRAMLAAFSALPPPERDSVIDAELARTGDGLKTFEALLRERGPPRAVSGGG